MISSGFLVRRVEFLGMNQNIWKNGILFRKLSRFMPEFMPKLDPTGLLLGLLGPQYWVRVRSGL
jgi:hypothetical protein